MTTAAHGQAGTNGAPGPRGPKPARPPLLDRSTVAGLAITAAILALGLIPTEGRGPVIAALRSAHALEPNRADQEKAAGGYYVGLIDGSGDGGRDELALALLGKPPAAAEFAEIGASRMLPGDFLQFELLAGVNVEAFGKPFTTNSLGLRDREYARAKPPGVFRIALLGSSMDMGWGVETAETYENRLEDWLNAHAAKRGLPRRFEVLNFAMAAYSPLHRLESFERKVHDFEPDLVVYAATRLDPRLLQIQLVKLLQDGVDLKYDFVKAAVADARLTDGDLAREADGSFARKEQLKAKLDPSLPVLEDGALGKIADDCRSLGVPVAMVIIPRASEADGPGYREADVARIKAMADRHGLPVADLTSAFDDRDPATVEIAPWDDHPNALGHKLLFLTFGRALVDDPPLFRLIFDADPPDAPDTIDH